MCYERFWLIQVPYPNSMDLKTWQGTDLWIEIPFSSHETENAEKLERKEKNRDS